VAAVASPQITVEDDEPKCLTDFFEPISVTPGANSYGQQAGPSVVFVVSGSLHWGGDDEVSTTGATRGSLLPGGVWSYQDLVMRGAIDPLTDAIWVIAPTGETVTVEGFATGVKKPEEA
jgi:hypothetical protein